MLHTLRPDDASRALWIVTRALGGQGSGNFGHGGRPGEVGGSAEAESGVLAAIQKADGGFTYNPITGHSPTTGFALSLHKEREQVLTEVNLVTLAKYAKDNEDLLKENNNFLGGWHNPVDNKFYLDVSTVVSSASEAERLAKQEHQLAYFDLQKGQSVAVEHPHVKAATAYYRRGREEGANTRRLNRVGAQDDWARAYKGRDRRGAQDIRTLSTARDNNPLQQLADQHQKTVKVAIQYAFMVARKKLATKNADTIANALHAALLDVLPKTLLGVLTSGGNTAIKIIQPKLRTETKLQAASVPNLDVRLRVAAGPYKLRFDNTNPAAAKWAKDHATELADDLSETTRERVKSALVDLFDGEADLDDVRDAVGDDLRADVIARTESMRAVNEGQRQGWDQAVEKGLLDEDSKRVWIATSEACPICDELDGEETTLDGEYPDPGGDGPPQHPNCRCTEGIVA